MWVVLFHFRGNLWDEYPGLKPVFDPVLRHGDLGVDLFFALSGFVLALNYLDRMGDGLSRRATARFLWARLARVWPVYAVTLLVAAGWHGVLMMRDLPDPVVPDEYTVLSFLRQVFMVVMWTEPDNDRVAWNGPSWSISAEWLVYLLFPVIVLLLVRLGWVLRVRGLLFLGAVVVLPAAMMAAFTGNMYSPYLWVLRLLGAFVGGGIACLAFRRIAQTRRNDVASGWAAWVLLVLIVGSLYATEWVGSAYLIATFLFSPFLIAISVSTRGLSRVFSTRAFVLGGHISYSAYLVHMLLIEPIWWAQMMWPQTFAPHSALLRACFLAVPFVVLLVAYAMWRWVEEPSRKVMRAMTKRPLPRTPDAPAPLHTGPVPTEERQVVREPA
ncbi:hypothetical protein BJP25_00650 [Actinokineospora bangkokensis]|uniref:Acyltransferase 3 domain-containing protein n=2 Tax=Actinokineospora bangkokensis TaxID=1193682 RepID=A0A1Q9LHE1_9PSEU|nr:hypothetical protein BJP25_00650 [Actinokineospora bangkokensis]